MKKSVATSMSDGRSKTFFKAAALAVVAASGLAVVLPCSVALAQNAKPNIILIVTDDQGVNATQGANWSNVLQVHTPQVANLAAHGRVFENMRVNPKCSPTRAGLFSGRNGLQTGVLGTLDEFNPVSDRNKLSLQTWETTFPELLKTQGYYNILGDKWHVGWSDTAGQMPLEQGFDVFLNYEDTIALDDPIRVGDEHMTLMEQMMVQRVLNRPDSSSPYLLTFCSIDPHKRHDDSGREKRLWWKVDSSLLPSGEDYYDGPDGNRARYRAVVEALDTTIGRLLRDLGVIDQQGYYIPSSNTVVFFMSDNGTPSEVAPNSDRAKGTLYEGGIQVPFLAFGANVPQDGAILDRLVTHQDLYETIADIAGVPADQRGDLPHDSYSFANDIGWNASSPVQRQYQVLSIGNKDSRSGASEVTIIDPRWKLIARAGGPGLAPFHKDEFYDLSVDPHEQVDLLKTNMTAEEAAAYYRIRDDLATQWPTAVSKPSPYQVDIPISDQLVLDQHAQQVTDRFSRVGVNTVDNSQFQIFMRFDMSNVDSMLPEGMTMNDATGAELIMYFVTDSTADSETDTGPLQVLPVQADWWTDNLYWPLMDRYTNFNDVCGVFDPPPHIDVKPEGGRLSAIPMKSGTPVDFGNSQSLLQEVQYWYDHPNRNYGVTIKGQPISYLIGDQTVVFRRQAMLRLDFPIPQ